MDFELKLEHLPPPPFRSDYGIGVVGAGFVVRDVQLVAYRNPGFNVCGLVSRTPEIAREVAELRGIPRVFDTLDAMLESPEIEIIDIAVPPDNSLRSYGKLPTRIGSRRGFWRKSRWR